VYVCLSQMVQDKPCGQEIAEYNANSAPNSPLHMYVFGEYVDEPLAQITPQGLGYTTHYYHANRLYCVAALTDNMGAVIERYTYTAYGATTILAPDGVTLRAASSYDNAYLHTGRRLDGETGNYYFRARYYSPTLGRFLGRDPLGYMDGTNFYAAYFAMLSGTDPLGLWWGWSSVKAFVQGAIEGAIVTAAVIIVVAEVVALAPALVFCHV